MSAYVLGGLLIIAGMMHFINPKLYKPMMPPWVPAHQLCIFLSGVAEVLLGIGLLINVTRNWAAWGCVLLFIAIFPANIYMLTSGKFHKIPQWVLFLRLPLQGVLIWWAYQFT